MILSVAGYIRIYGIGVKCIGGADERDGLHEIPCISSTRTTVSFARAFRIDDKGVTEIDNSIGLNGGNGDWSYDE